MPAPRPITPKWVLWLHRIREDTGHGECRTCQASEGGLWTEHPWWCWRMQLSRINGLIHWQGYLVRRNLWNRRAAREEARRSRCYESH